MKYIVVFLFLLGNVPFLQAQDDLSLAFDHESLLVSDIEESAAFYRDILHLERMKSPLDGNKDRMWFSLGGNYQLHLIREDRPMVQNDVATHFALNVNDLDAFIKFLDKNGVEYTNWPTTKKEVSVRPDNVRQIYVKDPDGYWIEINDATY